MELGSGTGLGAVAAALLGWDVVATDVAAALPQLRATAQLNQAAVRAAGGRLRVRELDWSVPAQRAAVVAALDGSRLDCVLAADVVWVEELVAPLADTLAELLLMQPRTAVSASAGSGSGPSRWPWEADTGDRRAGPCALLAHRTRSLRVDELFLWALGERVRAPVFAECASLCVCVCVCDIMMYKKL